jgi:hypothetical protein
MHVAALVGGVLAVIAVIAASRFLPRDLPGASALSGPLHSFEVSMDLPATVDDLHRAENARDDSADGTELDVLPRDRSRPR